MARHFCYSISIKRCFTEVRRSVGPLNMHPYRCNYTLLLHVQRFTNPLTVTAYTMASNTRCAGHSGVAQWFVLCGGGFSLRLCCRKRRLHWKNNKIQHFIDNKLHIYAFIRKLCLHYALCLMKQNR